MFKITQTSSLDTNLVSKADQRRSRFRLLNGVADATPEDEMDAPDIEVCPNCGRVTEVACACGYKKPMVASFTAEQRRDLAKKHEAMPDGSFPIRNKADLKDAIRLAGQAHDPEKARAWIKKRARELDAEDMIPETWLTAAGDILPQLFTVRQNEAGRFEVLNPEGTKVAETTEHADAQQICNERNGITVEPVLEDHMVAGAGVVRDSVLIPVMDWNSNEGITYQADPEMDALIAAIPVNPPADWFFMDEPDEPTPMTVTDEGLVYGHAAIWGTCHLGNPRGAGVCVQPPPSRTDYGLFHLGELQADGGEKVSVGQITLDTGHAPVNGASARTAAAHYDDTGTSVADVRATNGNLGIWYSGALRPEVTASQVRKMKAAKISGDWRGGELVGMLCVNVPGFPVPRTQARIVASADGSEEVMALVAAGIVGVQRSDRDMQIEVSVLAARAEGGIDGLASLAEAGTQDVTAAVEIERIIVRMTDEEAKGMPDLNASLEREVAMQVDFFRDHGYWSSESLSGGAFTTSEMQNVQTAGALLVVDPLEGASIDLRDKLISRGLLV